MEKEENQVKRSSKKKFEGSAPSELYGEGYFLRAEGSNYGRRDLVTDEPLFSPYTEEFYLERDRVIVKTILNSLKGLKSAIVLGCARGYMVQAFHEKSLHAVGVDISEWAIEHGAEPVLDHLYCGDICDLSKWKDKEFDVVIALDVLEHIRVPDLYKALDETCRVGKVIVFDAPIDIDDTHPDHSHGTDKTHVSVYSKEWWIAQFMLRGFEPIHIQEFTYRQEIKHDSRWPDKHDHGVTMYLRESRPPPTADTIVAVTIKPGSKDFKILWWSNSPWAPTGYGVGTKGVVYPLNEHYNVRALSYYGLEGAALGFNNLICYPRLFDPYGIDAAKLIHRYWKPDIMITLFDIWIGDSPLLSGERNWFTKINPLWVAYFPVDHDPIPPPIINQARQAYRCVAMSQFGRRQLEMEGISTEYIPHGVDTEVFRPSEDKVLDSKELFKLSETLQPNKKEPWPEGSFIIGKVATNKDTLRKGFDRDFAALQIFLDQNPDACRDTRMHLHTLKNFPGAYPLGHLAEINKVSEYIRVTNPFSIYCGMVSADLAKMYGAFDVLLNASQAEGFGIPIIEAAACGVPSIGTRFTSMPELIEGHGWLVNTLKNAGGFDSHKTTILMSKWAIPDEFEIAEALEDAYNNPDKVRRYGEKAREFSLNYDWEKVVVPLWFKLIEEIREELRPKNREERRLL